MNTKKSLLVALTATFLMSASASAGVVLIGNPGGPASASADEAKNVYLGKSSEIGGVSVRPVDQSEGSAVRNEFYEKVTGMSPDKIKAHWSKLTFTGKATQPDSLGDDAAVKAFVAKTPNAVGYISSGAADGSVKVLYTAP